MAEPVEKDRAEARREQVLTAAAACFSRRGFHAASMAEISREAGMSVGHIYHYFTNKEAIIAAIVQREQRQILDINDAIRQTADWGQGMVDHAASGVTLSLDGERNALLLEVLAEAARNPAVASAVRASDEQVRGFMLETLGTASGQGSALSDLDGRVEVLAALFDGLRSRAVRHPDLDREAVTRMVQRLIRALLAP